MAPAVVVDVATRQVMCVGCAEPGDEIVVIPEDARSCVQCGEVIEFTVDEDVAGATVGTTVDPVRQELAFLRAEDAELLAYARATVAAWRDGWPDPVAILAGLLEERGQMPRPDQYPTGLLALAYVDEPLPSAGPCRTCAEAPGLGQAAALAEVWVCPECGEREVPALVPVPRTEAGG